MNRKEIFTFWSGKHGYITGHLGYAFLTIFSRMSQIFLSKLYEKTTAIEDLCI